MELKVKRSFKTLLTEFMNPKTGDENQSQDDGHKNLEKTKARFVFAIFQSAMSMTLAIRQWVTLLKSVV